MVLCQFLQSTAQCSGDFSRRVHKSATKVAATCKIDKEPNKFIFSGTKTFTGISFLKNKTFLLFFLRSFTIKNMQNNVVQK